MDDRLAHILRDLAAGQPPDEIPDDLPYAAEVRALAQSWRELQEFALALSRGDLSLSLKTPGGPLAGSLKALQANLRHVTWQTQMVARGQLDQRVEFMGEFAEAFNAMVENLKISYESLKFLGTHDTLTGLFNRAFFDTELDRAARGRRFPLSLIVADVDDLKKINDGSGHDAGDRLLQRVALVLTRAFRTDDIVARIGGDEFGIILPDVGEDIAARSLARIRGAEMAHSQAGEGPAVKLSLGAATAKSGPEVAAARKSADARMYADKAARKAARA